MKINRLLLLAATIVIMTVASARPYPDEAGVCIVFKGDTAATKDVCVVSFSEGAGGKTTVLKTFNKIYRIEAEERTNRRSDSINDVFRFTVNGEASTGAYYRNASFYNVEDIDKLIELEEDYLYCYKTKSIDICHT